MAPQGERCTIHMHSSPPAAWRTEITQIAEREEGPTKKTGRQAGGHIQGYHHNQCSKYHAK